MNGIKERLNGKMPFQPSRMCPHKRKATKERQKEGRKQRRESLFLPFRKGFPCWLSAFRFLLSGIHLSAAHLSNGFPFPDAMQERNTICSTACRISHPRHGVKAKPVRNSILGRGMAGGHPHLVDSYRLFLGGHFG